MTRIHVAPTGEDLARAVLSDTEPRKGAKTMNIGKLFTGLARLAIKAAVPILKEKAAEIVMEALAKREAKKLGLPRL